MFIKETANIKLIVFGLTRPGLEPTVYSTRGEHANHYTTDTVEPLIIILYIVQFHLEIKRSKTSKPNVCH